MRFIFSVRIIEYLLCTMSTEEIIYIQKGEKEKEERKYVN